MKFVPEMPISRLTPAPYNPRKIDADSFAALVGSIREHGVIRPVIVTDKLTILAGHQRTKAMTAAGLTRTPVFMAEHAVTTAEELRFNQYHNAVDIEDGRAPVAVPPGVGWEVVDPAEIGGAGKVKRHDEKTVMARLLLLHGSWSNVIATESGRVLVGSLYASVSAAVGHPLLVRYVPDDRAEAVLRSFGREYGEFTYEHIPLDQWHQASNQPHREPGEATGGPGRAAGSLIQSSVYTLDVIPRLSGRETILDFGSGRGAYAQTMRDKGFEVIDVEFYRRKRGSYQIDHVAVQRAIDRLCEFLAAGRRFDVVVLDSVLNSVGTSAAETHVLTFLNALCAPGGLMAMSGKSMSHYQHQHRASKKEGAFVHGEKGDARFFDRDGNSAVYSRGAWYFQKYHTLDEVRAIAETYVAPRYVLSNIDRLRAPGVDHFPGTTTSFRSSLLWQLSGYKARTVNEAALREAVAYEFELPYQSGRTVGRSADVLAALTEGGFFK